MWTVSFLFQESGWTEAAVLICSYQKGLFEVTAIVWLVTKLKDTLISSTKLKLFIGLFNKEDILLVYVS